MANLLRETRRLIVQSNQSIEEIASGASVGRRWLYMLSAGESPNASVTLVQRVHDYLSARSVPRRASSRVLAASKAE